MIKLTAEEIESNWNKHLAIADTFFEGERLEKVNKLLEEQKKYMILAPASGKPHFHNAIPGGYVDHVNRVVHSSLKVKDLWSSMGAVINFTDEELVFSALFHDLGKIGDGEKEGYEVQDNEWRRNNLNEYYTPNRELDFMLIQDRSLYILQKYGIKLSQKEYIAIKIHDGLYDDSNKPYLVAYNPESKLRFNLPYILHQADMLASKVEYDKWRYSND